MLQLPLHLSCDSLWLRGKWLETLFWPLFSLKFWFFTVYEYKIRLQSSGKVPPPTFRVLLNIVRGLHKLLLKLQRLACEKVFFRAKSRLPSFSLVICLLLLKQVLCTVNSRYEGSFQLASELCILWKISRVYLFFLWFLTTFFDNKVLRL